MPSCLPPCVPSRPAPPYRINTLNWRTQPGRAGGSASRLAYLGVSELRGGRCQGRSRAAPSSCHLVSPGRAQGQAGLPAPDLAAAHPLPELGPQRPGPLPAGRLPLRTPPVNGRQVHCGRDAHIRVTRTASGTLGQRALATPSPRLIGPQFTTLSLEVSKCCEGPLRAPHPSPLSPTCIRVHGRGPER